MQLRAEQLEAHLKKALAPLYVVHGDEPLLAIEAADAIRAAARAKGHSERDLFISERGFDWGELFNAGASRSLFGGNKIVELRIPTGKPGTEGARAIERYCSDLNPECLTLVSVPRLDKTGQNSAWFSALSSAGVVVDIWKVERPRLPEWIGQRLARSNQRASREVLEFLADRVEGNLLAAHQEVQKLALLLPAGELSLDDVDAAVSNVARYDVQGLAEAMLTGDMTRYAKVLEGLRGEGEAPTFILWAVSEELRALSRILSGLSAGRPVEQLFRENRVWRNKEAAMKVALRRFKRETIEGALSHAAVIDRVIKGIAKGNAWDEFLKLGLELKHGR
jgi:DNA polymerase-3 subunit delta